MPHPPSPGNLDPSLIVTNSKDAYPHDHGFAVNSSTPEAINHHADAGVLDTKTGQKTLIDFTFTNAAGKAGKDGAEAGYHADLAEDAKLQQYAKEFPGFSPESSPSLEIISNDSAWSTTAAGARVRARTGMPERLQRTHGRRPIWSSLHLCQLFLDGFSRHWLSHSGVPTLAASCSSTAGHVMVLSKYGAAMRRRHWQLAQAMALK